tara:strand:- start:33122 stop:34312 length:1191 start_codon:yes stop_codon:yes gene_type:complete
MNQILHLLNRKEEIFKEDIHNHEKEISESLFDSKVLVIGGAGTIGQATTREIFKRNPKTLHIVDLSENNLVELVRDIRSSFNNVDIDFRTFALDSGSEEFRALISHEVYYDYVLNLSALKHVRNEEDPFTIMRMIEVNIFNTIKSIRLAQEMGSTKYFCVSTDKAANPVNMMGASKLVMEMFLMRESFSQDISSSRFANVAFSDGSLLHGFNQRFQKKQPLAAPNDIRRYFVTSQESGELCMLSALLGNNRDIFFPKLSEKLHLVRFSEIAKLYLELKGYECYECESEHEARESAESLIKEKKWPCFFFKSDTTGEKDFEEFYTKDEKVDMTRFSEIGIINAEPIFDENLLNSFEEQIKKLKNSGKWSKQDIMDSFLSIIPNFDHKETGKYLDQRM